jgi:NAD-dependent deacetylase
LGAIPEALIDVFTKSQRVAVLTGAGISQESGLRTFRDSQVGLWAEYKPEELATPEAFKADPKLVWDWYEMRRKLVKSVQPNPGHYALAAMQDYFADFTVITQNVDGLHQRAGNRRVIELHGNINNVKCFSCGTRAENWESDAGVPRCVTCGGFLRPDVVWFGESLPALQLRAATRACSYCDLFFSIGTSGVVQPAASLIYLAKNAGAVIVEINLERTPWTKITDFFLQDKSGEVLPRLAQVILS